MQQPRRHLVARSILIFVSTTGIAALFLPFAYGYSPVGAVFDGELWKLALPFFLAPFAVAGLVRSTVTGSFSRVERTIAYIAGTIAAAVTLSVYVSADDWPSNVQEWASWVVPLGTLLIGVGLLIRNSKVMPLREFDAVMVLLVPYLANNALCLIALFEEWQVGAYCVLVASGIFLLEILLISAQRANTGSEGRSS